MTELTWLHLSDWHQKGNEFDRLVVLKALHKDIREREKINRSLQKIDFVKAQKVRQQLAAWQSRKEEN